jgi:GNAT superfamily N-acetyltransferase
LLFPSGLSFTIQPARPADQHDLAQVYYAARLAHFPWLDPRTISVHDFEEDSTGEIVHVARATDGRILGFISVYEPGAFIHLLFVAPGHERQGIGTRLLQSLESWHPFPHRLKCVQANTAALDFYLHHGWHIVEPGNDGHMDYFLMEKSP